MDDPRIGEVLDERYRILERLAAGGMGVVYRGERVGLAKPVAIKFLHRSSALMPDRQERFRREAEVMSRLAHPNLMSIIDFGEDDGVPYLVMEFMPGSSLREALERGALDPRRAVFIAYQILSGLGSAHDSGVLHRDLKPGNVLLVGAPGEDLVKILDFGVAKLLDPGGGPTEVSAVAGRVLGTPEYMAPEQARSQSVDPRTDLYAVGIILYEMVVGRRPFEGDNDLAVLRQQIEDAPVPPRALRSEISRELDAVIVRALNKKAGARWPSAQEFATALSELPEGSGVLSLRASTRGVVPQTDEVEKAAGPPRRRGRGRRLAVLIALLLATVGGVVVAGQLGYVDLPRMPWESAPDGPPDAGPLDAGPPDAIPTDAAPPPSNPAIQPYVSFLRGQDTAPVDYIMGLFEDHDIVILCERPHPEWTQYELVEQLVRDPRFVEQVGNVFTEIGTSSLRPYVADLLHGETLTDEQILHVYRNLRGVWPYANYGQLLRDVHALNRELEPEDRVMVYPSDVPVDWKRMSKRRYRKLQESLKERDRIMADQIIDTVRRLERRTKALVIMNYRHAFRSFPTGNEGDNVGRYLYEAFPGNVASVVLNQMHPTLGAGDQRAMFAPIMAGKWDAAFATVDNRAVGFDLAETPFGRDPFDLWPFSLHGATYQDMFTGFVFYEPLSEHKMVVGIPGLLDDGFDETLNERRELAGEEPLTDEERAELETRQTFGYGRLNADNWAAAQQQIASWLSASPP